MFIFPRRWPYRPRRRPRRHPHHRPRRRFRRRHHLRLHHRRHQRQRWCHHWRQRRHLRRFVPIPPFTPVSPPSVHRRFRLRQRRRQRPRHFHGRRPRPQRWLKVKSRSESNFVKSLHNFIVTSKHTLLFPLIKNHAISLSSDMLFTSRRPDVKTATPPLPPLPRRPRPSSPLPTPTTDGKILTHILNKLSLHPFDANIQAKKRTFDHF